MMTKQLLKLMNDLELKYGFGCADERGLQLKKKIENRFINNGL